MRSHIAFVTLFMVLLGSGATAYSTEPTFTVLEASAMEGEIVAPGEICVPPISPELVAVLSIQEVMTGEPNIALACASEE